MAHVSIDFAHHHTIGLLILSKQIRLTAGISEPDLLIKSNGARVVLPDSKAKSASPKGSRDIFDGVHHLLRDPVTVPRFIDIEPEQLDR